MDHEDITQNAVIDIDDTVLRNTGMGGLVGKGYLHEQPFVDYLNPGERVAAVLWSLKTAPIPSGLPYDEVSLEGYRSITAITDSRVLAITGHADGDQVIELSLGTIEGFTTGKTGLVRTEQWLRFFVPGGTLKVFDRSGADIEAIERLLGEAVGNVKKARLTSSIERATTAEENGELKKAYRAFRDAQRDQDVLRDWEDLYGNRSNGQDLEQDIARVGGRIDFEACVEGARQAEATGELKTAADAYRRAEEIAQTANLEVEFDVAAHLERIDQQEHARELLSEAKKYLARIGPGRQEENPSVEELQALSERIQSLLAESAEIPEAEQLQSVVERLEAAGDTLEVRRTHAALRSLRQSIQKCIELGETAIDSTATVESYRGAIEPLKEYETRVADSPLDTEPDHSASPDGCEICGRATTTTPITIGDTIYQACTLCDAFDSDGPLWTRPEIQQLRADLGDRLYATVKSMGAEGEELDQEPPRTEIQAALRAVADNLGHPPSPAEFDRETPYRTDPHSVFENHGKALQATDLDPRDALIKEIKTLAQQQGVVPTTQELIAESRYPPAVFEETVDDLESLIEAAGFDPIEADPEQWIKTLREFAKYEGRPPTYAEAKAKAEDIGIRSILSRYESWDAALTRAGILGSVESDEASELLADLTKVAEALEHVPSKTEYETYGRFDPLDLELCFDSYENALSKANLPQPTTRDPTGPLDEPPDAEGEIPSHTTLLRELNWLVERHGPSKAENQFDDLASVDRSHFTVQFGSLEEAFETLDRFRGMAGGSEYVPKRLLDERLEELGEHLQRPPTVLDLLYYFELPLRKFGQKYDSLDEIQETAGHTSETASPTTEALLEDLAAVAESFDRPPTIAEYDNNGSYEIARFLRCFDSWLAALNAAGLDALELPRSTATEQEREADRMRFETQLRLSTGLGVEEVLLDELHRLVYTFDGTPSQRTIDRFGRYPLAAYTETFGSLDAACEKAGIDGPPDEIPDDYEQTLQASLERLADLFGHQPTQRLVNACGDAPAIACIATFGSWEDALEAVFDSADPPAIEAPFLARELEQAVEQLDTEEPQNSNALLQKVSDEITTNDISDAFGSLSAALNAIQGDDPEGTEFLPGEDDTSGETERTPDDSDGTESPTTGRETPTRTELIETLRSLYESLDRLPKTTDLPERTEYNQHDYISEFGSWQEALNAADIDPKKELLAGIKELAAQLGQVPSSLDMDQQGPYSSGTYSQYFGSWQNALDQVDLTDLVGTEDESETAEDGRGETTDSDNGDTGTRAELIETLRSLYENLDRVPKTTDLPDRTQYSQHDYISEFGRWQNALEAAGVDIEEELLTEIKVIAAELGRIPNTVDMDRYGSYSGPKYAQHFGSWQNALEQVDLTDVVDIENESEIAGDDYHEPDSGGEESKTKADMIETLRSLYEPLDRIPKTTDLPDHTPYKQHDYVNEFGSWQNALEAADIDIEKELLTEIRDVAAKLGQVPSSMDMDQHSSYWGSRYSEHFGSWQNALDQVDLTDVVGSQDKSEADEPDSTDPSDTPGQSGSLPREGLLEELRRLNEATDGLLKGIQMQNEGEYSLNTYTDLFGSWDAALEAAGVDKEAILVEELARLWDEIGHQPSTKDMLNEGQYSPTLYYDVFDSWHDALERVKELRSEAGGEDTSAGTETETDASDESTESESTSQTADSKPPFRKNLLEELDRVARETEGVTKATDMQEEGAYNIRRYSNEFGSWDDALNAAGIDREAELLAEVERVWDELGRQPSATEMNRHGQVSSTTVKTYFDDWQTACRQANPSIETESTDDSGSVDDSADDHGTSPDTTYLDGVTELAVWEDIPSDERLAGTYLATVRRHSTGSNDRVTVELQVRDLHGTECRLSIWEKHEIDTVFRMGHWYLIDNLRGKVWEQNGSVTRQLSSTRDLEVTDLGTDPDAATLRAEARARGLLTDDGTGTTATSTYLGTSVSTNGSDPDEQDDDTGSAEQSAGDDEGSDGDIVDQLLEDMELE